MAGQPPKKPGGFSLYGDLLNQSSGTITGAPVKYEMKPTETGGDASAAAQKKKDAALKFQPIKRPQANAGGRGNKGKGWNASSSSGGHKFSSSTVESPVAASSPANQREQPTSTFEDWVGNEEEDDYFFDNRKQQPRGRKKQKGYKRKFEEQEVDWDAIYDPSKPTLIARYKGSTEQDAERREWKQYLYRQAAKNESKNSDMVEKRKPKNAMFAPPSGLNFAPPSFDDPKPTRGEPMDVDDEDDYAPPAFSSDRPSFAPPPAPTNVPDDATGEDAYARRMRISGTQPAQSDPPPPPPPQAQPFSASSSSPAPPVAAAPSAAKPQFNMTEAQAKVAAFKAKFAASRPQPGTAPAASSPTPPVPAVPTSTIPPPPPPADDTSTLTRAPVRYNLSDTQLDSLHPSAPPTEPPSRAPGKKDFGARMMAKMGWEKGQGLGAQGEGITTPLVAQASKRKKRSDKDGGGWAQPRSMGKIVGGKKKPVQSTADDDGTFGAMSDVVKLSGMLEGLDVAHEIEENNLLQEIGEEFGSKYGSIERLFVWREEKGGRGEVFVKFTSQLSALRAVNATDGMTFAGNPVVARFFDGEKFEAGEYA